MSGFLGSGDVYIDRLNDNGTSTGLVRAGNATRFSIEPSSEEKQRVSKGRDSYGQVLDSVALAKPAKVRITFDDIDRDNLALILMGTLATVNESGGTVTDEVVSAKLGKFVELSKKNLSAAGLTVTHNSGTPTYVLGTDYEINFRLGMIRALAGGAIADAQSIKVSFTHVSYTGDRVDGATKAQIKARILLDGQNYADGKPVVVNAKQCVLAPASEFDFLSADFATLELEGSAVTPTGDSTPFTVELRA